MPGRAIHIDRVYREQKTGKPSTDEHYLGIFTYPNGSYHPQLTRTSLPSRLGQFIRVYPG